MRNWPFNLITVLGLLFFIVISNSCKKTEVDSTPSGPFILSADNPYVTIEYTDTSKSYDYAIEVDSLNYIHIHGFAQGSMGGNSYRGIDIQVWGNCKLLAYEAMDTLFSCERFENGSLSWTTLYNNQSDYNCPDQANYHNTVVETTPKFYSIPFSSGDIISDKDEQTINSSPMTLWYHDNSYLASAQKSWHIVEGSWLDEEKHYLVFIDKVTRKKGWVLFRREHFGIHVYEIARPK
jgi:hypothetical protein